MPEAATNPYLFRSLGKLARGLSALFWGLPTALLVCAETARADWLKSLGFLPAVALNALVLYGLWQMRDFQKQERPWLNALDRAMLLAVVNLGLCPFIFWHNKMPEQPYFGYAVDVLQLAAVMFLFNLNLVLQRLGAMLPDETLRQETRQFTALNRWLLVVLMFFAITFTLMTQLPPLAVPIGPQASFWLNHATNLLLIFFVLLPLAMTMALIWKTKEVILDAVFGARS